MKPKLGDVFEYVDGSCFLIGEDGKHYRISYKHEWELSHDKINDSLNLTEKKLLFNLFDVLGKTFGGKYAK